MRVSWSNLLVYRTNFLLQGIAPLFVFLVVKLSLWFKIFETNQGAEVGGYGFEKMAAYHLWILISSLLIFNGNSQRIAEDIRLGRISSYLIYPFQLWEHHAASFLARSVFQLAIALVTLGGAWALLGGRLALPSPQALAAGLSLALLGGVFWFWINFLVGLVGFWLEETWTLMVMLQIVTYFLSGAVIPLELYPQWMQDLLAFTPFPYIAYWPARLFLGDLSAWGSAVGILALWSLLMALVAWRVWKAGLRLYTAAGM